MMTSEYSRIGVAVPTYQRPEMLRELLSTIPPAIPVAVSDNGSTLSQDFKESHASVSFHCTDTLLPMFSNWNKAARHQGTEWIVVPSDDDLYLAGAFDVANRWIGDHPNADLVVFGHHLIDGDGKVFDTWKPEYSLDDAPRGFNPLRYGVNARMPSVMFRRALYDELGGFNESFKLTAADSDFVQRAALIGRTLYVPEVVSCYRVWGGGLTANRIASDEWMREIDAWCENVAAFDQQHGTHAYTRHFRDEIVIQNLLTGVRMLRSKSGRSAAMSYLRSQDIPKRAKLASYARMIRAFV
jgi:GT2 family glycosyltransferase